MEGDSCYVERFVKHVVFSTNPYYQSTKPNLLMFKVIFPDLKCLLEKKLNILLMKITKFRVSILTCIPLKIFSHTKRWKNVINIQKDGGE